MSVAKILKVCKKNRLLYVQNDQRHNNIHRQTFLGSFQHPSLRSGSVPLVTVATLLNPLMTIIIQDWFMH